MREVWRIAYALLHDAFEGEPPVPALRVFDDVSSEALRVVDQMIVRIETDATDPAVFEEDIRAVLKMRGSIELVSDGGLPRDGIVVEDARDYDN